MPSTINMPAAEIRRLVSARQAAEVYGFTPNRAGFIRCPFHDEKTASLKFFDDGGWKCFGCGAGGSAIDFVMKLFDLSFPQAVIRIDSDFHLGITARRISRPEASRILERRRKEQEERDALEAGLRAACAEHRYWWEILQWFSPSQRDLESGYVHPLYLQAIIRQPRLDGLCDELADRLYKLKKGVRT